MTENKRREPTLADVMREIKRCRKEAAKSRIEEFNRAVVFMIVAFGASIALFGLSYVPEPQLSIWSNWLRAGPAIAVGVFLMILAAHMAGKKRKNVSKD